MCRKSFTKIFVTVADENDNSPVFENLPDSVSWSGSSFGSYFSNELVLIDVFFQVILMKQSRRLL